MKIVSVVGARPNFIKIGPFIKEIKSYNKSGRDPLIEHILVHTGQHYDYRMSKNFFDDLDIPEPDINLEVGSGTHAEQVGNTMIEFEKVLTKEKPDWVVVVGDVNAILACSITAKKENIKCCHIEAGLRSGDMTMPEEVNRLVTDRISDLLLTPDLISSENLLKEGIPQSRIKFVGNIMIDTLEDSRVKASVLDINEIINKNKILNQPTTDAQHPGTDRYALLTLHRPSNVDRKDVLKPIIRFLAENVTKDMTVIWPLHPRSKKKLIEFDLYDKVLNHENIILLQPLGYLEMLSLNMSAKIMLTDSGGLQEECTILGTPCLTMRLNTERPVTLRENGGVSVLVGNNVEHISKEYLSTRNKSHLPFRPEFWDGQTAGRCVEAILNFK